MGFRLKYFVINKIFDRDTIIRNISRFIIENNIKTERSDEMKRCMYWLIFFFCCVLLTTVGCQHDPVIYAERIEIVKELPVYCSQLDSSELVSADEINWEAIAFQSEDEVKNYFSEAFLQAYPDYLKVDFSKYTLLVRTYYDFRDYEKREFSLVKNMEEKILYFSIYTENVVSGNPEPEIVYIERIAFVVEKLDKDYSIKTTCSVGASE